MGYKIGSVDLLAFGMMSFLLILLALTWDDFSCIFPIHGWLLGVYLMIITTRYAILCVQNTDNAFLGAISL